MISRGAVFSLLLLVLAVDGNFAGQGDTNIATLDNISSDPEIRYNEYPLVVTKRAALLLDRIMVALQRALEDHGGARLARDSSSSLLVSDVGVMPSARRALVGEDELSVIPLSATLKAGASQVDRRGQTGNMQPKGRVWRCYFNAVTCFKKK